MCGNGTERISMCGNGTEKISLPMWQVHLDSPIKEYIPTPMKFWEARHGHERLARVSILPAIF